MGDPAPKPRNLDAMSAAFASGDTHRIARELREYDLQLVAAGLPPATEHFLDVPDLTESRSEEQR